MKTNKISCLLACFLLIGGGLFAGSLDYLSNQSAGFGMTLSRNAATEGADIAAFNPAGTPFLSPGLHIDLSNQLLFKMYSADTDFTPVAGGPLAPLLPAVDGTYEPDVPTWFLPNLHLAYNFGEVGPGKLAAYFAGGVPAGGGTLEWKDGTAGTLFAFNGLKAGVLQGSGGQLNLGTLASQSFTASSIYIGAGVGAGYAFLNDKLSVSLGGRFVYALRSFALDVTFENGGFIAGPYAGAQIGDSTLSAEYEYNAWGITPIIGLDVQPISGLILSARYEMETALKFKYEEKKLTAANAASDLAEQVKRAGTALLTAAGIEDGKEFNQNLPHIIALGAAYDVIEGLNVSVSGAVYLLPQADLGKAGADDLNSYFDVGWDISLGASYKIIKGLKLGLGVMYTEVGTKDSYYESSATLLNASANPPLSSIAGGLGGSYTLDMGLSFTLSGLWSHYLDRDFSASQPSAFDVTGTYKKDVINIGIGIGYTF
jgi:long-chain fatty acid transport protein